MVVAISPTTQFCCVGWSGGGGTEGFFCDGVRPFFLREDAGGLGSKGRPMNVSIDRMTFRMGAGRTTASQKKIPRRVMPTMVQSRFIA